MIITELLATASATTARLWEVHAAQPDPNGVVGLSHDQREAFIESRFNRERALRSLETVIPQVAALVARRDDCEQRRRMVTQADETLAAQNEAVPDWRGIGGMAGNREWQRQHVLIAGRRALHRGVEFYNGIPAVPAEVMTASGGSWLGSLIFIETEVADLDRRIAEQRMLLEGTLGAAEALLRLEAPVVEPPVRIVEMRALDGSVPVSAVGTGAGCQRIRAGDFRAVGYRVCCRVTAAESSIGPCPGLPKAS